MMSLEKTMANARHAYDYAQAVERIKKAKLTIPQIRELRRLVERKQWEAERETSGEI